MNDNNKTKNDHCANIWDTIKLSMVETSTDKNYRSIKVVK